MVKPKMLMNVIDGAMAQHALNECQTYLSEPDWLLVM
ncbi:hypothetical protein AVP43_00139 [Geobacillus stearothermophilus]|nr:hypothetical protein GARCT_00688 [Geobacillus sp. 12AMOR1]KZE97954.1 hypothetical protein AVP43_00139 [Geobacillus stearothermophilus]STO36335.1 Uncharacterised protein [[Flavobacterium] thermophilum]